MCFLLASCHHLAAVLCVLVVPGAKAVPDLMGQGHHGVRLAGLHPVVDECHEGCVIPTVTRRNKLLLG